MSKLNWEQKDAVYFILHSSDGVLLRGPTPDGGEGWVWFEGDTWWCCPINGAPVTEVTAARLAMSIMREADDWGYEKMTSEECATVLFDHIDLN